MMARHVAVIIPNWNGAAYLAKALESLAAQTYPIDEVIVVDNGSSDDSIALAERAGARVIALPSNRGFAYAVNRGIESAQAKWLAIVNNDVVLDASWLAMLMAAEAWFATGKILSADGNIDGTYDTLCRGACSWRCGAGRPDGAIWNQAKAIRFAPFTAAVFRRELFDRVGLLDEGYESYLEDVDFGLRCALAGVSGIYVPQAKAIHRGSATLGRWHRETVRRIARNQLLLVAKHYPRDWVSRCGWRIVVAQLLWGFVALRHGAGLAYLQGKLEGIRSFREMRRPGLPALYRILEESEREIRDLQERTGFDTYWKLYLALT